MYTPSHEKRRGMDPVVLALLVILCLVTVFLFYGYILAVVASIMFALVIAGVIYLVLLFVLVLVIVPLYYLFFTKNEVEENTTYSIGTVKGMEDTEDEKRGRL